MAHYGSSDSGASLGDILGAAIRKAGGEDSENAEITDDTEENKVSEKIKATGDTDGEESLKGEPTAETGDNDSNKATKEET